MAKKYDHMTITGEDGVTQQTESASVKLENPLGMERSEIATSSGDHNYSYQRKVPRIVGNAVFTDGQKLSDMDFKGKRITLKDTESGKRIICHNCCTASLGALGKDNPEWAILVLGGIQEL
jgi:hypothetical protein